MDGHKKFCSRILIQNSKTNIQKIINPPLCLIRTKPKGTWIRGFKHTSDNDHLSISRTGGTVKQLLGKKRTKTQNVCNVM